MEVGTRVTSVTSNVGHLASVWQCGAISGAKVGISWSSMRAQHHFCAASSAWKFFSQDSSASTRQTTVYAAKQSRSREDKSKAPSSTGKLDINNDVKAPPQTQSDEGARAKGVEPAQDEETDTPQRANISAIASREDVLRACLNTSGALAGTGLVIRQASHWAAGRGLSFPDCYVLMPYGFEVWHLGATAATVALVASLRQVLLSVWPEFSVSSQTSNKQVLSSLEEPRDYLLVSFLPGVAEELLFRGALLPLVGVDWRGVAVSGIVFGILHVSGGRNAAFATWASFVGVVYGLAAISTSNLAVPMVAHAVSNLIAALVWQIGKDGNIKEK